MSKPRKSPAAPFVQTVAVAVLTVSVAPACGSSIFGADDDDDECGEEVSCNPPFPDLACPDEPPAEGEACDLASVPSFCTYPGGVDGCGSPEGNTDAECVEGAWEVTSEPPGSCNPPGPTCPLEAPEPGSSCNEDPDYGPFDCSFTIDIGCGEQTANYTCSGDVWTESTPTCNPPPPDFCPENTTPETCATHPDCQWLEPGCGDPALPAAGCFSATECAADSCDSGLTCQTVVVDPCWNQPCGACGLEVQVCLP